MNNSDPNIVREAYTVIGNLLGEASDQNLVILLDEYPGLIGQYVKGFEIFPQNLMASKHILETFSMILARPQLHQKVRQKIEEAGTFVVIDSLQSAGFENEELSKTIEFILSKANSF